MQNAKDYKLKNMNNKIQETKVVELTTKTQIEWLNNPKSVSALNDKW